MKSRRKSFAERREEWRLDAIARANRGVTRATITIFSALLTAEIIKAERHQRSRFESEYARRVREQHAQDLIDAASQRRVQKAALRAEARAKLQNKTIDEILDERIRERVVLKHAEWERQLNHYLRTPRGSQALAWINRFRSIERFNVKRFTGKTPKVTPLRSTASPLHPDASSSPPRNSPGRA